MMFLTFVELICLVALSLNHLVLSQTVLSLDASTFRERVNEDSLILVTFTAPWCGHCVSIGEELKAAAFALFAENVEVRE